MSGGPSRSKDRAPNELSAKFSRDPRPVGSSPSAFRRPSFDPSAGRRRSSEAHLLAPAISSQHRSEERRAAATGLGRWEAAVGNLEDARVAFDVLARAVDDAVYLDEDAFNQIAPTAQFTKVLQAQQRRIARLEAELKETRFQLGESNSIQTEALRRHAEMQEELENNAVVFKMHYQELLAKDDEIQKLTTVIQALSGT